MIRQALEKDINDIVRMSKSFWGSTIYNEEEFKENDVYEMAKKSIEDDLCLVYENEDGVKGFVCGILGCLLANFDVKAGTELAWWVDKEYRNTGAGLKLLNAIEEKAKSLGIKYWNMVYMESSMPKQIKGIYESMGYIRNENLYTKRLM